MAPTEPHVNKRDQILAMVSGNPRYDAVVQEIIARLEQTAVTPELVDELISGLEYALDHPDQYEELRAQAIQSGIMSERDAPVKYNRVFIVTMLAALYAVQDHLHQGQSAQMAMARGGLASSAAHLQSLGRSGDTILAHINPKEAEILRRMGGGGTINPNTGLLEFKSKIGSVLGVVAMVAMPYLAPVVGGAMASGMGLTLGTMGTAALGGATIGGLSAALQGGDPLKGALMGGVTGGISGGLGNTIGSALLPAGTNSALSGAVGAGLAGGFAGAATGQGFTAGAVQGLTAHGLSSGGGGEAPSQINQSSLAPQPGQIAGINTPISQLTAPPTGGEFATLGQLNPSTPLQPMAQPGGSAVWSKLLTMAPLAVAALSTATTPEQIRSGLTPQQREYFDRKLNVWDWSRIQSDAAAAGEPLGMFVAKNWDTVNSGRYNKVASSPKETPTAAPAAQPEVQLSRGGALNRVAYLAQGSGTGRSDDIPARLSDGEFVLDAETVALLGDGSTSAGARKLDEMRAQLRRHKGAQLARGNFSQPAKSPLNYMKEVA